MSIGLDWVPEEDIGPFSCDVFALEAHFKYDDNREMFIEDTVVVSHCPIKAPVPDRGISRRRVSRECPWRDAYTVDPSHFFSHLDGGKYWSSGKCYEDRLVPKLEQKIARAFLKGGNDAAIEALTHVWLKVFGKHYRKYLRLSRNQ